MDLEQGKGEGGYRLNDRKKEKRKAHAANLQSEAERGRRAGSETVVSRPDKDKCPDPSSSSPSFDCASPLLPLVARLKPVAGDP